MNGNTLSAEQIKAAGALADKYIAAGQASKQFAQDQQALNNALRAAVNVSLPMTGLATAFSAAQRSLETARTGDAAAIALARGEKSAAANRVATEIDRRREYALDKDLQAALKKDPKKRSRHEVAQVQASKKQENDLRTALEIQKAIDEQLKSMVEEQEKRAKLSKSYEANLGAILRLQDEGAKLEKAKLSLERERTKLPLNNELGTQNAKEDLKIQQQILTITEAQNARQAALINYNMQYATANEQERKGLLYSLEIASQRVEVEQDRLKLVEREVELQKMLNLFADRRRTLDLNTARTNLQLQKERNKDALARGVAGSRAALRNLESNELARLMQDQLMAETALRNNASERATIEALSGKARTDAETKYQSLLREEITLQGRVEEALQKVRMARQALSSEGFFARQGLLADDRQAQISVGQNVGMLGRATIQGDEFTQQALELMKSQGYTSLSEASAEERERLKNTVQEATVARIELGMMQETSAAIGSAFSGLFDSLLDGTKSLKQALGDMMKQLLSDLAQAYLKAALLQSISSMGFGLPGARYGGIMSPSGKSFAVGGIASGPQSGYMATLHGREAVIPLGNDRSVPVELKGGGGSNVVNVSVNVAADGQSNVNTQGGNMEGLGKVIGQAVQQELMRQKRPGGMLSPYGAA